MKKRGSSYPSRLHKIDQTKTGIDRSQRENNGIFLKIIVALCIIIFIIIGLIKACNRCDSKKKELEKDKLLENKENDNNTLKNKIKIPKKPKKTIKINKETKPTENKVIPIKKKENTDLGTGVELVFPNKK